MAQEVVVEDVQFRLLPDEAENPTRLAGSLGERNDNSWDNLERRLAETRLAARNRNMSPGFIGRTN